MFLIENWGKSKERLEALWEKEIIDRCCISVEVSEPNLAEIPSELFNNKLDLVKYYTDAEYILERHRKKFENTYYGGDAFPCIFPYLGTGGHIAYLKNVSMEFAKDTIWFHETIKDWESNLLEYDPESPTFKKQIEIIKYLVAKSSGEYFVSMPDNCGSVDGLSQLRGTDNLMIDFIEEPEKVKKATSIISKVLSSTSDTLFNILKENNLGGSVHSWMQTWCPVRHMQLQCDTSVMVSPKIFEEFYLPELEEATKWLDRSIYHLDGEEQIRHLDMILSIKNLDMIQWTPVAGQPPTFDFIPVLQKIQRAGKGLVLIPNPEEVEKLMSALSPKGLQLVVKGVKTKEDARTLVKKVEYWSQPHK
ncbi:MAG TPA: hypothetical protein VIK72_15795 [Clostridiaceae bacterium]